jgi:hypothetical protein
MADKISATCSWKFFGLFKSCIGFCGERKGARRNTHMPRTGRPRQKVKLSATIKTLAYPDDAAAFEAACVKAKQPPPHVLRELAKAWVAYVEKNPRANPHFKLISTE